LENKIFKYTLWLRLKIIVFCFITTYSYSQSNQYVEYSLPKKYEIGGITISGTKYLNTNTILSISGLKVGDTINVPGAKISDAINNLWNQKLFSDINIRIEKKIDNLIFLNINLSENKRLSKFNFVGKIKKSDVTSLKEELKLMRGKVLTENLINNSIEIIKEYYIEKGFYSAKINYKLTVDTTTQNSENLTFIVDAGKKIKIDKIIVNGRKKIPNNNTSLLNRKDTIYALSDKKIRRLMKETKEKNFWRIFKVSKFIKENYEDDKKNIIAEYNKLGYRDARIISDSFYVNKNLITLELNLEEGEKYKFGDISFVGNKIYSDKELNQILNIKQNDIFNQSILDQQIFGSEKGVDISSLYLDDGYLFFNATPIEKNVSDNIIDLEIRIYEGEQARINRVSIKGNTKTNDHVIMREIRTKPGNLFKRSEIMRTQRELAQLQYFDPESFDVKIDPDPSKNKVDITYILAEKSSDQIQLQGGWGAGRVVGSLGLTFNNFSTKNIFNKKSWDPLPSGDGQRLSLTASSNGIYYQQYRMSFVEPWLGNKKPNSLSVSLYKSITSNGQTGENRQAVELTGFTIGLGQRLKYPDDYFTIYNGINFQQYELINSQSFFSFSNGFSNNINYEVRLGRNSIDQLVFPRSGSNFSLSLKLTPPYSMFEKKDYNSIRDQEKFKWIEYYKWNFKSAWYSSFTEKLVLNTKLEMGLLGAYNNQLGIAPFERFYVGGDGLSGMGMVYDGRELISLRGYQNNSVSSETGASIYNKYVTELRYAISLNPASTVYILGFLEAGNAWDKFDDFNPFSVKRSAGIGVRIMLPMIGMMGVDYGWGFDDIPAIPNANGGQFHFSMGQQF
tara:strand:- start:1195 stop:3732 length:2538 start_codon:yes stop_codon:yes gene_type:complete